MPVFPSIAASVPINCHYCVPSNAASVPINCYYCAPSNSAMGQRQCPHTLRCLLPSSLSGVQSQRLMFQPIR
ncbi:hypothetical protein AB205_0215640 [Aquarana catesbeiana]|uniref:Uncharacterized protein n=1 Tax=Aquarana catesbeiana TaxID=8400 RepID=A0A2G9RAA0_AQUCT|nr:hypothetical protein AB205_0215640 [Aquarana catesbeiana]